MKNKILCSIFILSLLCLISCQSTPKGNESPAVEFRPDTVTCEAGVFSEEVKYVPLETMDNSVIGSIDKIIFRNGNFYIFDKTANMGVFVFGKEGKFKKSLCKIGEGPGEYIAPVDFDVDEFGNIYVADNAKKKIVKYQADDFDSYEDFDMGCYFMEFAVIEGGDFLLADVYDETGIKSKVSRFSVSDKSVQSLLAPAYSSFNEMNIMRTASSYLFRSGNELYYYPRFTSDVYHIGNGKLEPFAKVVSERYFKEEELPEFVKSPQKFMVDREHIKDINVFYQTKDGCLCGLVTFPLPEFFWISDGNVRKANLMGEEKLLGSLSVRGVADDYFICYADYSEEMVRRALEVEGLSEQERPIFADGSADSNPILILFRLK